MTGGNGRTPGEIIPADGDITVNEGREAATVTVKNTGDRAVQIGSHYHFFEVNHALEFDREQAFGMHLDVPAGASVRFEPGDEIDVDLVAFGGKRRILGLNGLTDGSTILEPNRQTALRRLNEWQSDRRDTERKGEEE